MRVRQKPLHEQVIVITGGSSGNGLATAQAAVDRGAAVVIAARNAAALEEIGDALRARGGRVSTCVADVANEADVERIADVAARDFGGFDSWVNCASVTDYGTLEQIGMEEHRRVFEVNYFGLVKGSLVALKHLRQRGSGSIINVGSVLSDRSLLMQGPYCASKHAVRSLTEALRMEVEREKLPISVTLIKPTAMHTPFPEHARNHLSMPPRLPQIMYDPRLVADAILFAAEHPRRQLYIGGSGFLISAFGRLFPRATDLVMETVMVRAQQSAADPGDPSLRDNLFQPRPDGDVDGHQKFFVRRQSLFLQAQKRPVLAAAVIGSALLAASGIRWKHHRRRALQQADLLVSAARAAG